MKPCPNTVYSCLEGVLGPLGEGMERGVGIPPLILAPKGGAQIGKFYPDTFFQTLVRFPCQSENPTSGQVSVMHI